MAQKDAAKEEPVTEIELLKKRIAELEESHSELRHAEDELRKQKQLYENIVNTSQAVVLVLDTKGRIVQFNPYMEQISGYRLEEVKGKDWFETFIPEEIRNRLSGIFLKAIGGIQTKGNVNPVIAKDGRELLIEWYDKTIKGADGSIEGLVSIGVDITGRAQADLALHASEKRYRTLFEQSKEAIFIADPETRMLVDCNKAALEMIGYSKEEILSMPADRLHPKDAVDQTMEAFKKQAAGEDIVVDSVVLTKAGQRLFVSINTGIVELQGKAYLMGIFRDVTERIKMEKEAQKRLHELEVFYKASLGREERILELKKRVAELEESLKGFRTR